MAKSYLQLKKELEINFPDFATKSFPSKTRKKPLSPSKNRTDFERDGHRILHFPAFRRLRHKTQVFFAPKNDHLCTRMEHALHVASISTTICNLLNLNADLANAISLGHDLGHPPFGHHGEDVLKEICKEVGEPEFMHEAQSYRVADRFIENGKSLRLTYETLDGIVCHYGEQYEKELQPDKNKNIQAVNAEAARRQHPATLEGCVVRMADKIAYVGRDLEDAIEVGIISKKDVPTSIKKGLGSSNSEIIGTLIDDVVRESQEIDAIRMSKPVFERLQELTKFNRQNIYESIQIKSQFSIIDRMINDLFYKFMEVISKTERGKNGKKSYPELPYQVLFEFIHGMKYTENESDARIVTDYIAGMTDTFAHRSHNEIFGFSPRF